LGQKPASKVLVNGITGWWEIGLGGPYPHFAKEIQRCLKTLKLAFSQRIQGRKIGLLLNQNIKCLQIGLLGDQGMKSVTARPAEHTDSLPLSLQSRPPAAPTLFDRRPLPLCPVAE